MIIGFCNLVGMVDYNKSNFIELVDRIFIEAGLREK